MIQSRDTLNSFTTNLNIKMFTLEMKETKKREVFNLNCVEKVNREENLRNVIQEFDLFKRDPRGSALLALSTCMKAPGSNSALLRK